jgi:hypothetical protein
MKTQILRRAMIDTWTADVRNIGTDWQIFERKRTSRNVKREDRKQQLPGSFDLRQDPRTLRAAPFVSRFPDSTVILKLGPCTLARSIFSVGRNVAHPFTIGDQLPGEPYEYDSRSLHNFLDRLGHLVPAQR